MRNGGIVYAVWPREREGLRPGGGESSVAYGRSGGGTSRNVRQALEIDTDLSPASSLAALC